MTHARLVLGAVGAAAVLAAGCGSSSDDAPKPAPKPAAQQTADARAAGSATTTPEQFLQRADALCSDARTIGQRANAAVRKAVAAGDGAKAAAAIDRFLPAYEKKVDALKELDRPQGGGLRAVNAFMKVMDGQVTTLKAQARAMREDDAKMMQKISAAQTQASEFADTLAQGIGFQVCGRAG